MSKLGKCSVVDCGKSASDSLMLELKHGAMGWVPLCSEHLADYKVEDNPS